MGQYLDDYEANFNDDGHRELKDPYEFPTYYFAKENSDVTSNFGDNDSNWDDFYSGHADNIEKDIHSLSRHSDEHTAPPDDYNQVEERSPSAAEPNYDDDTNQDYGVSFLCTY